MHKTNQLVGLMHQENKKLFSQHCNFLLTFEWNSLTKKENYK